MHEIKRPKPRSLSLVIHVCMSIVSIHSTDGPYFTFFFFYIPTFGMLRPNGKKAIIQCLDIGPRTELNGNAAADL